MQAGVRAGHLRVHNSINLQHCWLGAGDPLQGQSLPQLRSCRRVLPWSMRLLVPLSISLRVPATALKRVSAAGLPYCCTAVLLCCCTSHPEVVRLLGCVAVLDVWQAERAAPVSAEAHAGVVHRLLVPAAQLAPHVVPAVPKASMSQGRVRWSTAAQIACSTRRGDQARLLALQDKAFIYGLHHSSPVV